MTDETPKPETPPPIILQFPQKRVMLQTREWQIWHAMSQVCPHRAKALTVDQPICTHGMAAPESIEQRRVLVPINYIPFPACEGGRCPLIKDLNSGGTT